MFAPLRRRIFCAFVHKVCVECVCVCVCYDGGKHTAHACACYSCHTMRFRLNAKLIHDSAFFVWLCVCALCNELLYFDKIVLIIS